MSRTSLLVLLLALGTVPVCRANDNFEKAVAACTKGQYDAALQQLALVEKEIGRPTPKVESLKVYAYVAQRDWVNAKVALENYRRLAGSSSSKAHEALLKLQPDIEKGLAELETKAKEERAKAKDKALAAARAKVKQEEQQRLARTESLKNTQRASVEQLKTDPTRIVETVANGAPLDGQRREAVKAAIKEKTGPFSGRLVQMGGGLLAVLAAKDDAGTTHEWSNDFPQQRIEALLQHEPNTPVPIIRDITFAGGRWRLAWQPPARAPDFPPPVGQSLEFYAGRDVPTDKIAAALNRGALVQRLIWDEQGQRWGALLLTDFRVDPPHPVFNREGDLAQWLLHGERLPQMKMKELQKQGCQLQDARWNGREWVVLLTYPGEEILNSSHPVWFVADDRADLERFLKDQDSPVPTAAVYGNGQWLLALDEDQNHGTKNLPPYLTVDSPTSALLDTFREAGHPLSLLVDLPTAQP